MVHHYETPQFLRQDKPELKLLTDEQIKYCMDGWLSVLREHKGVFDEKLTEEIAADINRIILWHAAVEANLIYGDFHLNNLLFDDDGEVVICDWQCVTIGQSSEDLGFFLSRFNSDGFDMDEKTVIDSYIKAVYDMFGKRMDSDAFYCHMSAGTLITSFLYWHEYLHGNAEERVGKVYRKMGQIMSHIRMI